MICTGELGQHVIHARAVCALPIYLALLHVVLDLRHGVTPVPTTLRTDDASPVEAPHSADLQQHSPERHREPVWLCRTRVCAGQFSTVVAHLRIVCERLEIA